MDPTAIGPPAARDRLGDTVRAEIARRPIRWAGLPDIGPSVPIVVVTFARSLGPGGPRGVQSRRLTTWLVLNLDIEEQPFSSW